MCAMVKRSSLAGKSIRIVESRSQVSCTERSLPPDSFQGTISFTQSRQACDFAVWEQCK
jgi:hypothetical protein